MKINIKKVKDNYYVQQQHMNYVLCGQLVLLKTMLAVVGKERLEIGVISIVPFYEILS